MQSRVGRFEVLVFLCPADKSGQGKKLSVYFRDGRQFRAVFREEHRINERQDFRSASLLELLVRREMRRDVENVFPGEQRPEEAIPKPAPAGVVQAKR